MVDDGGRVKWKVFGSVKRAAIYVGLEFSEYRKKRMFSEILEINFLN